ncbi:uncharacterized protein LOC128882627 isoform X2 [Hylaeus volcanicus]|uniref:uncharacterized protein LOC128882627 isoform X2 n=1 Tax=Hylaeus volcanicus TaxID=313075 RepID=UPI0023B86F6C|nr:uncharacterized protein LOC128882627 isoform X2 [Hylaeus volcanicus]
MFSTVHKDSGQCTRKLPASLEVAETDAYGESAASTKQELALNEQTSVFLPIKSEKKNKYGFTNSFCDLTILVELAWASRNPESTQHGSILPFSNAHELSSYKSKECDIKIKGIGNMQASDESAGASLENSSDTSSDNEIFASRLKMVAKVINSRKKTKKRKSLQNCQSANGLSKITSEKNVMNRGLDLHQAGENELVDLASDDSRSKLGQKVLDQQNKKNILTPPLELLPYKANFVNPRIDNTTYLLRSCIILSQNLLHYLIFSLIAGHNFPDAAYLFSIYLLTFPRSTYSWININDYRLFQRFFTATPDLIYSSMRLNFLEKCFGNPTMLRHDIVYDICQLNCIRRTPDEALLFLDRLISSRVSGGSLAATIHACMAWSLYSKWLKDLVGENFESSDLHKNLEELAIKGWELRSVENIRHQMDTAVLYSWKNQKILPTDFLRLLCWCYVSHDTEKLWSFLQDLLSVAPCCLDLIELKLLLLQLPVNSWNLNEYFYSMVANDNNSRALVETTLRYAEFSRGEPAAFNLVLESFPKLTFVHRLQCIFHFLNSNCSYAPFWRVLVEETVGRLGIEKSLKKKDGLNELYLWTAIDDVLTLAERLQWYRKIFDANRKKKLFKKSINIFEGSCISLLPVESHIFVLLVAPLFVSSWKSIVELAAFISTKSFQGRRSSLILPRRQVLAVKSLCSITKYSHEISKHSKAVVSGFTSLLFYIFESNSESKKSVEQCPCILNTEEISLLTEVAFRLILKPSTSSITCRKYRHRQQLF